MSAANAFDVVIQGGNKNTRTLAAFIIERAFEHDGFVNVETILPRDKNKTSESLLDIMRQAHPRLFEKQVVIQELTTLPTVSAFYERGNDEEDDTLCLGDDETFEDKIKVFEH